MLAMLIRRFFANLDQDLMRDRHAVGADIVRYVRICVRWAHFLTAYGLIMAVISRGENARRIGISWWMIPMIYYGAGIMAGAVLGVLDPLRGTLRWAMFVSFMAMLLPGFCLSLLATPGLGIEMRVIATLFTCAIVGPVYAWAAWSGSDRLRRNCPGQR